MARSIWKGAITFGLVSIPVELFPAEERKEFEFSMLDKRDFSPVGYKRYSKRSGKEGEWSNIVKGYEYKKDQYVVLSDEDFKRANVKASRTLEIQSFVQDDAVSPEYFETPYYLAPVDRGEKVYALLRETLRATGRMGIAQFVLRSTQHLAAIKPESRALMLFTLRYADELRGTSGFELPAAGLKEARLTSKEIDLAKRLIDDMTEAWNPAAFKDTYHQDLMARIHEKIKKGETKQITEPSDDKSEEAGSSNVIDLAALLKKSIYSGGRRPKAGAKGELRVFTTREGAKAATRRKRA
jgi:DNA end-binding protein Ku